ncbi:MAG: sigma-70 family RNA polymerase sigma factor [Thermoanaerobaculia bacterium]
MGRHYNRTKAAATQKGIPRGHRPQNGDDSGRTVERLAATYGVGHNTIERNGKFAAAVETLKAVDPAEQKDTLILNDGAGTIRPEDHLALVRYALRGRTRPEDEEDDIAAGVLVLVQCARAWNAGRVTCGWTTFVVARVRWAWIRRHFNRGKSRRVPEVPLFLAAPDDEEAEIERPEMAVEDPELSATEARTDVAALLAHLSPVTREVLVRRFGLDGEPASREEVGAALGLTANQVAGRERGGLSLLRKVAGRKRLRFSLT